MPGWNISRGLTRLVTLDLSSTKVTDAGLKVLANFTRLQVLDVRNTKVTKGGVERLEERRLDMDIWH